MGVFEKVMPERHPTTGERKFIDGLQDLLQIPDGEAMKIVDVMIIKNSA